MKSKIRKSVIPFGAIIATTLFVLVAIFAVAISTITHADNNEKPVQGKMLTIYDRGTEKIILTEKATIGEALKEAGIAIDGKDVVEPAVTEKLIASDYQVNIYRARLVMIIDGNTRTKITTAYQTASQIVKSAGITLYDEDRTSLSSTTDIISDGVGLQVTIDRATSVNLTLYGKTSVIRTHEKTIGKMLFQKGIKLSREDLSEPGLESAVSEGQNIRIWREGKQVISVDEDVAFGIDQIDDADREVGYSEIKTSGEKGLRSASYEVTIQDGVEVGRVEIASITLKQPKKQVEIVGAKGKYSTPSENETITWNFLISKGFSKLQTAGIMGNLMQEHGFETSDTWGGFGIAQWTGGRRENIISRPNSDNIYVQLNFLMEELSEESYILNALKSANSLEKSVQIFQDQFERCGLCREDQRISYSRDILASH